MKKFIIFIVLSTGSLVPSQYSGGAFAQNPGLPSVPCQIVLKNNKLIKDVRLWEVYPDRVEYEKEGSLHDLLIEEIERIETDDEIITFEPGGKLFKQPYDLIILHPGSILMQIKEGDTIKCRITRVTGANIYYYRQKKRQRETYVPLVIVKRFIRNGVEYRVGDEESSADKSGQPPKESILASKEGCNDMIITKMAYPDGNFIKCNIAEVKSDVIYYSYQRNGKEKKTWIELARVKKYIWNGVEKIPGEVIYPKAKISMDKQPINYNKSNIVYSERPQYVGRPPISESRVVGEIFAGGALGFAGGAGGGLGGALVGLAAVGFEGAAIGAVIGAGIGYTLGTAGGVYLVGSNRNIKGNYGAAVGGAILGAIGGGVLLAVAVSGDVAPLAVIAFFLPPIGAAIAFNSTRRYKSSGTANSINLGFNQNGVLLTYKF